MRLWLTFGLGVAVVHVALGFVNVSATALWEKIVKAAKDAGASAEQLSNGLTEAVGSLGHGVITVVDASQCPKMDQPKPPVPQQREVIALTRFADGRPGNALNNRYGKCCLSWEQFDYVKRATGKVYSQWPLARG
ncbi:hypothetical protein BIW11_06747 [Tropilaelaps mercedesae]|uniref:Uncharacterized protein n=1 Tax=Tropilaelaps mercedesae TaxID=418985 RepID=A0A1V9XX29_9ACAR|nr:hypothetical protein BIW11_06747 [Tropilaelaps mercedesae]